MSIVTFKEILPLRSLQTHPTAPRSARMPAFLGMKDAAAVALDDLGVAVIGTGSVGSEIATQWARQGIGRMYLVDPGLVKAESLLTHSRFQFENIGKPKASLVGHLCRQISPQTQVFVCDDRVQSLSRIALAEADLVYLATDNLPTEVEVGQLCLHLRIPLVHAAVDGATLIAQVRVFTNTNADGSCPRCCFGASEIEALNRALVFSCNGALEGEPRRRIAAQPTMSPSFLCTLAANIAVTVGYRHALGVGAPLVDSAIEYCGYTHRTVVSPLRRSPDCPCQHRAWERRIPPQPLWAECTLRELAAAADLCADEPASFTVDDDLAFVEWAKCRCGKREMVQRFCRGGRIAADCSRCGEPLFAEQFYSHRSVASELLHGQLDLPLRALGAEEARWILVQGDDQAVIFPHCRTPIETPYTLSKMRNLE